MRSLQSIVKSRLEPQISVVEDFQARWIPGGPSLEDYLRSRGNDHSLVTLSALIKLELRHRFESGERPRVEEYLRRFPTIKENRDQVVSLVYEEFCLREESGELTDSLEFCSGYAPWSDSLHSQIQYHRQLSLAIGSQRARPAFPSVGDRFDKYQLIEALGEGAIARVYLATEDDLGGRLVVLKVSASFGQEPTILARLNHRNIIPILTFARSETGLRGICMPYRSGMTLDEMIKRLGQKSVPESGNAIRDILSSVEGKASSPVGVRRDGWEEYPAQRSYSDSVAWIGLALADALEYLHGEGVLHRDIKPANILLSHEGGPQLFDFNLAQEPQSPENVGASIKGGTLPYMAPEQLHAFLEISRWSDVGRQADIYSLGLVLRELATGRPPRHPDSSVSLPRAIQALIMERARPILPASEINPLIPPSLDSIFAKCLAFDPTTRYSSAAELSEDLRRFLDRRPLRFAANSSVTERTSNWIFRNRLIACSILIVCFMVCSWLMFLRPVAVQDRAEFQRGVMLLDSPKESAWSEAQEIFARLRESSPRSAWPTVNLAAAVNKLDHGNSSRALPLFKDAIKESDAESAFLARIKKEPNSSILRTHYALVLIQSTAKETNPEKKNHSEVEARLQLQESIRIDPKDLFTLSTLIALERDLGRLERAVELCSQAIAIALPSDARSKLVDGFLNIKLTSLVKLAGRVLEVGDTPMARVKASTYCNEIESTIGELASELETNPSGDGKGVRLFMIRYYRGCMDSVRGVLASDLFDFDLARRTFDQAEADFKVSAQSPQGMVVYKKSIESQERILRSRRERFEKSIKLGLSFRE